MKMGLARQLWLLLVLPIAFVLGLYGYMAHENRRRVLLGEASAELRNHATLVEAAIGGAIERGEVGLLEKRIQQLARADRILGIAAFKAGGEPILVTEQIAGSEAELAALAQRAFELGEGLEEPHELAAGPALVRTVTFIPKSGGPLICVLVRDLRYLDNLAAVLDRGLALTGALLLGITALIAALVSRATIGRPAGNIVEGVERVASGDLQANVPEEGALELARLARAFNRMTVALREAQARAEHEEAARIAVERKLQHAQALAAAGQVAASIGHEIGSPLNVILGRARRAAELADCPENLRKELETIAQQSERISRVVARLLDVARPPRTDERGSDIARVVDDVLVFLGPECRRRNIQTRLELCTKATRVTLDADHCFQVIFNLCLNAVEAQKSGGEILVRIISPSNGARVEGSERVMLEIVDQGSGVAPEAAARVFEPFFTTKTESGGSGLGLAIVSGIVREAGGSVELASSSESGSCFRVALLSDASRPTTLIKEALQ